VPLAPSLPVSVVPAAAESAVVVPGVVVLDTLAGMALVSLVPDTAVVVSVPVPVLALPVVSPAVVPGFEEPGVSATECPIPTPPEFGPVPPLVL
jgi:hypothetical protein